MLFGRSAHCWQWGVLVLYYNWVAVNVFLAVLQDFPSVFGCPYVGCIYIYNVHVSWWTLPLSIMKWLSGSLFMALVLKSILSDLSMVPWLLFTIHFLGIYFCILPLSVCVCLLLWAGSLLVCICAGHVFSSIQLSYIFPLVHLNHLHLRLLLIDTY